MRRINKKSAVLAATLIGIFVWHFTRSYKSRTDEEPRQEELLAAEAEGRRVARELMRKFPYAPRGQLIGKTMAAVMPFLRRQANSEE